MKRLESVFAQIEQGAPPAVILVGGTSEFLAERAFREIRDAIVAKRPTMAVESYEPGTDLVIVLDSYRTMSLFGSARLLILPELNAFVSSKEIAALFEKSVTDWRSAKTDRKRATSAAKLLHLLGLAGADLEMTDRQIAEALGVTLDTTLAEMIAFCRTTGKKAGRGEGDASLLMEAIARGGSPGTILLMRTGEIPRDSATIDLINRHGAVVVADLTREGFSAAFQEAIGQITAEANVQFDAAALARFKQRLGIERMLADKFSRETPDLRLAVSEAERLATLAGEGGRISAQLVDREVVLVEGGARYELGSLLTEGKLVEAVAKLRDLVAQARREDPKASVEIQYGRYLFPLADEVRQIIGVHSFARMHGLEPRTPMPYNRFKDTLADKLGDYLKANGMVKQRPHPFPLHKKWEAAKIYSEADLFRILGELADIEVARKGGGAPVDVAIETLLLGARSR